MTKKEGRFICKCDCGGEVRGIKQFDRLWTWCERCSPVVKIPTVEVNVKRPELEAKMAKQTAEFDALQDLIAKYQAMPAVVDDDYPRYRHYYETALRVFIDALRNNGRL